MKQAILSEEVQQLVHRRPPRIIRNGNLFFVVLLAGFLVGSWYIRVPSVVVAPLHIRIKDGEFYGQMKIAAAVPVTPGQRVVIRAEDLSPGPLPGIVEGVSHAGDSNLIIVRLQGAAGLTGANFSAAAKLIIENERLFDRLRGMARLWHR